MTMRRVGACRGVAAASAPTKVTARARNVPTRKSRMLLPAYDFEHEIRRAVRSLTERSEEVEVAGEHPVDAAGAVAAHGVADERSRLDPVAPDDRGRQGGFGECGLREAFEGGALSFGAGL